MDSEFYIRRCLELARMGFGNVSPNPMVGCVIVHDDKIIGEGYHVFYGGAHAEVNAINSVHNKELLKESTLYVNLEPCVHFGKTPPCTDLILECKIPKVVISSIDCYSEVQGKGVRKLVKAGVDVTNNVLSSENRELNKRFFTYYEKKRPYIILKWAQTINGYIDIKRDKEELGIGNYELGIKSTKGAAWITNEYSDILVHKWRSEEDSIIVGTNTALIDNPQLNVRHYKGKNPVRIVIDRKLRLPKTLKLFDNSQPTIVFNEIKNEKEGNIEYVKISFKFQVPSSKLKTRNKKQETRNSLTGMLDELYKREIQSIIVEGGKYLLNSFIDTGLWDEARVFICNKTFNEGNDAPKLNGKLIGEEDIHGDKLIIMNNEE